MPQSTQHWRFMWVTIPKRPQKRWNWRGQLTKPLTVAKNQIFQNVGIPSVNPRNIAERGGFEPPVLLPGHSISNAAQSAALPSLRGHPYDDAGCSFSGGLFLFGFFRNCFSLSTFGQIFCGIHAGLDISASCVE